MIAIIDYGMGNLGSIKNMIKKIGYSSEITNNPSQIESAKKLILPGVGKFDQAMANLAELKLIDIIKERSTKGTPLLGICLGMQLLANDSEEGQLQGLGIISGHVRKLPSNSGLKVPHMGWNRLDYSSKSSLFIGFEEFEEARFYFVHSYHYECNDEQSVIGTTAYGKKITSAIQLDNTYGVQFHPEKSHRFGMRLIQNFIEHN